MRLVVCFQIYFANNGLADPHTHLCWWHPGHWYSTETVHAGGDSRAWERQAHAATARATELVAKVRARGRRPSRTPSRRQPLQVVALARGVSVDSIGHASRRATGDAARRRSRGWSLGCAWRTEVGLPLVAELRWQRLRHVARRRMSAVHFVHGTWVLVVLEGRVTLVSRNVRLRHPCPHARGSVDSGRRRGEERALISALGDDGGAIGSCTVAVRAGRAVSAVARGGRPRRGAAAAAARRFRLERERRRGVGKALIASEAIARGWGYDALSLEVLAANTRARSFYEDQGYRVVAAQALPERRVRRACASRYRHRSNEEAVRPPQQAARAPRRRLTFWMRGCVEATGALCSFLSMCHVSRGGLPCTSSCAAQSATRRRARRLSARARRRTPTGSEIGGAAGLISPPPVPW